MRGLKSSIMFTLPRICLQRNILETCTWLLARSSLSPRDLSSMRSGFRYFKVVHFLIVKAYLPSLSMPPSLKIALLPFSTLYMAELHIAACGRSSCFSDNAICTYCSLRLNPPACFSLIIKSSMIYEVLSGICSLDVAQAYQPQQIGHNRLFTAH